MSSSIADKLKSLQGLKSSDVTIDTSMPLAPFGENKDEKSQYESREKKKTYNEKEKPSGMGKRHLFVLTPQQADAAAYSEGSKGNLATAGSGKTATLGCRICDLIEIQKVNEEDVAAMSFTKASSEEIKDRVDLLVGRVTNIQSGTLHSFCVKLLFSHAKVLGYNSELSILDPGQQSSFLDQIMLQVTGYKSKKEITQFSTEDVKRWLTEMDVRQHTSNERDFSAFTLGKKVPAAIFEICKIYKERCRMFGYLDFDSILTEALRLLKLDDLRVNAVLPKYVFIDEAQDLSAIQWFIVEELGKRAISIDVIGDDDQSIYYWRGALPWRFRNFIENADKKCFLSSNRRCAKKIVELASQVISVIPPDRRVAKDLTAHRSEPGVIRFSVLAKLEGLILVAKKIQGDVESGKKSYSDFAFIARGTTFTFPAIEGALKRLGIPYKILGGKSTFDKQEARLFRSIANLVLVKEGASEPLAHWQTLLGDIGVTDKAGESILKSAQKTGGLLKSVQWAIKESNLKQNKNMLERILNAIVELRKLSRPTIKNVFEHPGVNDAITSIIRSRAEAEIMARKAKEGGITDEGASLMIQSMAKERFDSLQMALAGYMEQPLSLAMMSLDVGKKDNDKDNGPKVTITTAHSSKGLEWDTVFVMEVNAKNWPSGQAGKGLKDAPVHVHQDIQDEERRLLFVAITRAKNELFLMSTATIKVHGEIHQQVPSTFLPNWLRMRIARTFIEVSSTGESQGISIDEPFQ